MGVTGARDGFFSKGVYAPPGVTDVDLAPSIEHFGEDRKSALGTEGKTGGSIA